MDAFIQATTWHYEAFLGTGEGDVWRIWFGPDGLPLMEKLTPWGITEYHEAVAQLGSLEREQAEKRHG